MNNLRELLDTASTPTSHVPLDVDGDLRRGRRALHRRRAAIGGATMAGLSVAALVTVPLLTDDDAGRSVASDDPTTSKTTADDRGTSKAPDADPNHGVFAAPTTDPDPYVGKQFTLPYVPEGWEVQGEVTSVATIVLAPTDGSALASKDDFMGKVIISHDLDPIGADVFTVDGRTYAKGGDSGYKQLYRSVHEGEPAEGRVYIQWPSSTGWEPEDLLDYIDNVRVAPDTKAP